MNCHVHLEKAAIGTCSECGKGICPICLNKEGGRMYCDLCARLRQERAAPVTSFQMSTDFSGNFVLGGGANRIIAALLALFLGSFGIQYFYMGRFGQGLLCAIMSWSGLPMIWGWIMGVRLLTLTDHEFAYRYFPPPTSSLPHKPSGGAKPVLKSDQDYEKFILRFARERRGVISVAELAADTELSLDKAEKYLTLLAAKGVTRAEIDENNGRIHYIFAEFQQNYLP